MYPREIFSHWAYRHSFPFGPHVQATTLPGYAIIYRQAAADVPWQIRRHESEHVAQCRRMGWALWAVPLFYVRYFGWLLVELCLHKFNGQAAYEAHPMEVEAYARQMLPWPVECPDHPVVPGVPT